MRKFIVSTESTADFPQEYIASHNLSVLDMVYSLNDVEYGGKSGKTMDSKTYFDGMRNNAKTHTAMVTPEEAKEYFSKLLVDGDVVHIAFSSALSGTCNSLIKAAEELNKTSINKVYVVDSKAASLGEGLLVHLTLEKADTGITAKECYEYALSMVDKINHYFVVDDLEYLFRGGRVSKTAAFIGTLLRIKPVLHVDSEGRLIKISTVITRRKSLQAMVSKMEERFNHMSNTVFISHGDCIEDAQYVANAVKEKFGIEVSLINSLGPVIGSHSGPGTVALFFTADNKAEPFKK